MRGEGAHFIAGLIIAALIGTLITSWIDNAKSDDIQICHIAPGQWSTITSFMRKVDQRMGQ